MPTTTTRPTRRAKAGAKSATKPAAAKRPVGRGRSSARKTTQTKAARAKAARTRALNETELAARGFDTATRDTADLASDYAERAVLIPVGAALIARDRVLTSVNDTISRYSSTSKAQAQLRRFERRGTIARNRIEREVRKTRVRVERELRQRRRKIEKTVEERRDAVTKNSSELANRVQERILSLV
jgi:hypothetical protein